MEQLASYVIIAAVGWASGFLSCSLLVLHMLSKFGKEQAVPVRMNDKNN
jgi:hypothetical protein